MDIVGKTLETLAVLEDEGIIVQQGWYDESIKKLHVTVWNLGDYGGEGSDDETEVEIAAVQVCIWSNKDQVKLMIVTSASEVRIRGGGTYIEKAT